MESRRWFNQNHPQTLQVAVFILYINAGFSAIRLIANGVIPFGLGRLTTIGWLIVLTTVVGGVLAGKGLANERKWSYPLALGVAAFPFLLRLVLFQNPLSADFLSLMFEIALVALLIHPMTRNYQRIWFK
ncbi:MAG: hypothetical protein ACT4OS_09910 [Acidimicrobiales bacterium]